jgi:hypothetical protein
MTENKSEIGDDQMGDPTQWRYCQNCHGMFYDGKAEKGVCSAANTAANFLGSKLKGHVAQPGSYKFVLPQNVQAKGTLQGNWRFCMKCSALFYNGFGSKGRCAGIGEHQADTSWELCLPHHLDPRVLAEPYTQKHSQQEWRFCGKCYALFYNGYGQKGQCPAGGEHLAHGWNFALPHDLPAELQLTAPLEVRNTLSEIPVVGIFGVRAQVGAHVILRQDGTYRWWGEIHNSSAVETNINVAFLLKDTQNNAYPLQVQRVHTSGFFEPNQRNVVWGDSMQDQPNASLKDNWIFLAAGYRGLCNVSANLDSVNMLLAIAAVLGVALALK